MPMPTGPYERLSAVVRGAVQGVGYRFYVLGKARALGITGYARNLRDGSVEVVAEGPRPHLERLLTSLRQGPAAASVAEVEVTWSPASSTTLAGFTIRH